MNHLPIPRQRLWTLGAAAALACTAVCQAAPPVAPAAPAAPATNGGTRVVAPPTRVPSPSVLKEDPNEKLTPPSSEEDVKEFLTTERWHERAYGLSLLKPKDSRMVNMTVDDAVVRIGNNAGDYAITVYVKKSPKPINISGLQKLAMDNILIAQPDAVPVDKSMRSDLVVSNHTAGIGYFLIPPAPPRGKPDPKAPPPPPPGADQGVIIGQAFMRIDQNLFVMMRLETEAKKYETSKRIFEAIFRSLEIEDPEKVKEKRTEAAKRGEKWHDAITFKEIKAVLVPEQYFRVVDKDKDIGWMQIKASVGVDDKVKISGATVHVRAYYVVQDAPYEVVSDFFVTEDLRIETWTIETTMRQQPQAGALKTAKPPAAQKWVETGMRDIQSVNIIRKAPTGETKNLKWELPANLPGTPRPYVSQVELYLLDNLLPRRTANDVSFYAYSPALAKMGFRTERVTIDADSSAKVYSSASPDQPEQVSVFDKNGRLVKRELPGGQLLLPSTEGEIKSKWNLRD